MVPCESHCTTPFMDGSNKSSIEFPCTAYRTKQLILSTVALKLSPLCTGRDNFQHMLYFYDQRDRLGKCRIIQHAESFIHRFSEFQAYLNIIIKWLRRWLLVECNLPSYEKHLWQSKPLSHNETFGNGGVN